MTLPTAAQILESGEALDRILNSFVPEGDDDRDCPPDPRFDLWDSTPHAYFTTEVRHIRLGDVVLGGTHQIEGLGRANQRGSDAIRLDLSYLVGRSIEQTGRLILPMDHKLQLKRYTPDVRHRWTWVRLGDADPGLIPDYRSDTDQCCDLSGTSADDVNRDGYERSQVMCDGCAESWAFDYEVVRG